MKRSELRNRQSTLKKNERTKVEKPTKMLSSRHVADLQASTRIEDVSPMPKPDLRLENYSSSVL